MSGSGCCSISLLAITLTVLANICPQEATVLPAQTAKQLVGLVPILIIPNWRKQIWQAKTMETQLNSSGIKEM